MYAPEKIFVNQVHNKRRIIGFQIKYNITFLVSNSKSDERGFRESSVVKSNNWLSTSRQAMEFIGNDIDYGNYQTHVSLTKRL